MTTPSGPDRSPAHRARDTTRWDIQGLRAFAVLAVVLYHLWPNRLPGGFVGVDVFFVISGYLITAHLLREQRATGRLRLGQFWARRAKRLLPGAFLTIAATGAAVLAFVPSALWGQYGRELIASTVYAQNWQLASDSVDYLASDNRPSPFQHFWSLSVEEQFYIALPLLLIAVSFVARGRLTVVTRARVLLGAVGVLSLVWCIAQTGSTPGVAYFSTATRAWEFALGGLAATVALPRPSTRAARVTRLVGAAVGAGALVTALWVITPSTPFPGTAALLPVLGATLLVTFGARTVFESLGALRPVAFTGRISYALYLWHWPAVVVLPLVLGHALGLRSKLAILVGALVLASLTTVFVEEPLRFSGWVRALRPRRVAVLGVVCSLVVASLGVGTLTAVHVQEVRAATFAEDLTTGHVPCFGAAARIGSDDPCRDARLADVRVPAPAAARHDDANRDACWSGSTDDFNVCALGKTTGYSKRLIAIGDSHNNVWLDVYDRIGKQNGWRIDVAGHGGCYLTTAVQSAPDAQQAAACTSWKRKAIAYVQQHQDVDALLVTHSAGLRPVVPTAGQTTEQATVTGMTEAWGAATAGRVPVIALRDNPVPRADVITCVSEMNGPTDAACDQPRQIATSPFEGSAEAVAAFRGRAAEIDLTDYYCTAVTCPPVIGGVVVYRDGSHVTATFAQTLEPYFDRALRAKLSALQR